jgi:hypothetical protein
MLTFVLVNDSLNTCNVIAGIPNVGRIAAKGITMPIYDTHFKRSAFSKMFNLYLTNTENAHFLCFKGYFTNTPYKTLQS